MRQARHQYSLAPHTAHYTVIFTLVVVACGAPEVLNLYLLLAMSACPVTVAVCSITIPHISEDMALIALCLNLVVECD